MEQTTSRLRKTFHYPTDGESDDNILEALDEEEQEKLIQTLHQENQNRNKQYIQILLAVPIASILPYLPTLFTPHTTLLSLLSITSLLSTAYLLYTLPPGASSIFFLDNLNSPPMSAKQSPQRKKVLKQFGLGDGPIAQYLPYLNLGLCTILVFLGMVVGRRREIWWGFGWLPAFVQAVVLLAKWVMASVDPEGELGSLRYGFKGA